MAEDKRYLTLAKLPSDLKNLISLEGTYARVKYP